MSIYNVLASQEGLNTMEFVKFKPYYTEEKQSYSIFLKFYVTTKYMSILTIMVVLCQAPFCPWSLRALSYLHLTSWSES